MSEATYVLIPGNMCDERIWSGSIRAALPGAVAADTTGDDTITAMAARALSATEGPLIPIGFSMGAIVALEMARQSPDRILGAVLIGVNAGADLPERAAHRPIQQAAVRWGGLERILVDELKPNYLAAERRGDRSLLELLRQMGLELGAGAFIRQSEALRTRADLTPVLAALDVPIALLCGEEDALCPPAWHHRWHAIARRSTLTIVPGAGHMLPLEAPQAVLSAILSLEVAA